MTTAAVVDTTPAPVTVPPAEADEFAKFFDEISSMKEGESLPRDFGQDKPEDDAAKAEADKAAAEAAAKAEADKAAAPDAAEAAVAPVVEPDKVVAALPDATNAALEKLADLIVKRQPAPTPQAKTAPALFTDAEKEVLAKFDEEWPEQSAALALILRGALAQNNAAVLGEVSKVVAPALKTVSEVSGDHHYSAIKAAIPDYDANAAKVVDWVEKDPKIKGYLRTAYKGVIENGTVDEVSDLFNTWRQASGVSVTTPVTPTPPAVPAKKTGNELSDAAKQAAAALAPVNSKRTAQAPAEPTGFEDAFEKFSRELAEAKKKP